MGRQAVLAVSPKGRGIPGTRRARLGQRGRAHGARDTNGAHNSFPDPGLGEKYTRVAGNHHNTTPAGANSFLWSPVLGESALPRGRGRTGSACPGRINSEPKSAVLWRNPSLGHRNKRKISHLQTRCYHRDGICLATI